MSSLLNDVKIFLNLTADDSTEDRKLNIIIENGKHHLRRTAPDLMDTEFETEGTTANYLLLNFCRYAFSNADEMFDINYSADLINLRMAYEVRAEVSENENQDAD